MFTWIFSTMFLLFLNSPETDFKRQLENYLHKNLSSYDGFEYEIVSGKWDEKNTGSEIIEEAPLLIKGDLASIQVKLTQNGKELKTIFNLRLKLYKILLTSAREIKKGEPLSINDFRSAKIDVAHLKGTPFNSADELMEYEAKVNISQGTVLVKEIIEKSPIIQPGNKVQAVLESENVLVSTEATSKQEGAKGDIIKIEIQMNGCRKIFKAKIEDFNKVTIVE
jgi:flagella basal body P-ring formation protein FlgA